MFDKSSHLGHILLESLRARPDSICQIDASTGEEESNASVARRSVRLARCLRRLALAPGDVLALSGRNHLRLQYPYVAALLNGLPLVGIDPTYKIDEVKSIFKVTEPKVAFCEPESYDDYVKASAELGLATRVFTFGTGEHSMQELVDTHKDDEPIEEFEVAAFDTDAVYAWLVCSGGTTGVVKVAAVSHDALKYKFHTMLVGMFGTGDRRDQPHRPALHLSSIQWISGVFNLIGMPVLHQTKIQTSAPATPEHVIDMINKYKPVSVMVSPSLASGILNSEKPCDLTCFQSIVITGGKIFPDILLRLKERVNRTTPVMEAYGQTENLGPALIPNPLGPVGNCGRPFPGLQVKLVDPETDKEITESNVTGELWTKGTGFSLKEEMTSLRTSLITEFKELKDRVDQHETTVKELDVTVKDHATRIFEAETQIADCYYNNPEETAAAFTEDGWYKTGDLLYRDDENNYYFVERMKMLIKYRSYHIIPPELEAVIRSHAAVADVSVTSVPHEADGEHAVACVVTRRGAAVTAREIEELVASKLSETKQLRGGVVFLDALPYTHAGKVARGKLRQLVLNARRE